MELYPRHLVSKLTSLGVVHIGAVIKWLEPLGYGTDGRWFEFRIGSAGDGKTLSIQQ